MNLINKLKKIYEYFKPYAFNKIQLTFCVDTTGSMEDAIKSVKVTVRDVMNSINDLKFYKYEFAVVGYRDHPPEETSYVTKHHDFADSKTICKFIDKNISAKGGGDFPEAVLDGLDDCVEKLSWSDKSVKIVFHVADAPPHGEDYYGGYDSFPKGCPKHHTARSVSKKFKAKGIHYILLDSSPNNSNNLRKMKYIFSDEANFGPFKSFDLENGVEMLAVVADQLREVYNKESDQIKKDVRKSLAG